MTERRFIIFGVMQQLACENGWFTKATNDNYYLWLNSYCSDNKPNLTTDDIYYMALDVAINSDLSEYEDTQEAVKNIMFLIARKCVTSFDIEDKDACADIVKRRHGI